MYLTWVADARFWANATRDFARLPDEVLMRYVCIFYEVLRGKEGQRGRR